MKPPGGIKLITMRNLTFALVLVSAAMKVLAACCLDETDLGFHQDDESKAK
jgi:hypothetical protein